MLQRDNGRTRRGLEFTITFGKLNKDVAGDAEGPGRQHPSAYLRKKTLSRTFNLD